MDSHSQLQHLHVVRWRCQQWRCAQCQVVRSLTEAVDLFLSFVHLLLESLKQPQEYRFAARSLATGRTISGVDSHLHESTFLTYKEHYWCIRCEEVLCDILLQMQM